MAGLSFATRNALASHLTKVFTGRGNKDETGELRASRLELLVNDCSLVDVLFVQEMDVFSLSALREAGFVVRYTNPELGERDSVCYGTAVCVRPSSSRQLGESLLLAGLEGLKPGKLPTVAPWTRGSAVTWLVSLHLEHPMKERTESVKNHDMLEAVQKAISEDGRYRAGQAVVCGLDGNSSVGNIRKVFSLPLFQGGEVLSCGQHTCSNVDHGGLGGEEVDYFYIVGAVTPTSKVTRGPMSFPFHVDGSPKFLLDKRAWGELEAVAASDHAQLYVQLALRPGREEIQEEELPSKLLQKTRRNGMRGKVERKWVVAGQRDGLLTKVGMGQEGLGEGRGNDRYSVFDEPREAKGEGKERAGMGKGRGQTVRREKLMRWVPKKAQTNLCIETGD